MIDLPAHLNLTGSLSGLACSGRMFSRSSSARPAPARRSSAPFEVAYSWTSSGARRLHPREGRLEGERALLGATPPRSAASARPGSAGSAGAALLVVCRRSRSPARERERRRQPDESCSCSPAAAAAKPSTRLDPHSGHAITPRLRVEQELAADEALEARAAHDRGQLLVERAVEVRDGSQAPEHPRRPCRGSGRASA